MIIRSSIYCSICAFWDYLSGDLDLGLDDVESRTRLTFDVARKSTASDTSRKSKTLSTKSTASYTQLCSFYEHQTVSDATRKD